MGRPSSYTSEIGNQICEGIAQGKSLVRVCNELDVPYTTVYGWIDINEEFRYNYTYAREAQADYLADGILDIADDSTLQADDRRVKIDARKWYAGKLKPKKYGDTTQLKHADADGNKLDIVSLVQALDGTSTGLPKIGG
jgi:hypothetical protein